MNRGAKERRKSTTAFNLGQQGQAASNNVGNIYMTSGAQQGQDLNNAAAATASGYVGAANAFGGLGSSLSQYELLKSLMPASTNANLGAGWV